MDNLLIGLIIIFCVLFFILLAQPEKTDQDLRPGLQSTIQSPSQEEILEGMSNDEVIQNIASVYNKEKMSLSNLDVTRDAIIENVNIKAGKATLSEAALKNATSETLKTGKLLLGDKWLLTAVGKDTAGSDDDWLRFLDKDGKYYGGIAAGKFYDIRMGDLQTVVGNLQNQINSLQAQVNQRVVIGGRYGFHRGHDNSIIWDHGIILNGCYSNNCRG